MVRKSSVGQLCFKFRSLSLISYTIEQILDKDWFPKIIESFAAKTHLKCVLA
jgi:hypothetical protein